MERATNWWLGNWTGWEHNKRIDQLILSDKCPIFKWSPGIPIRDFKEEDKEFAKHGKKLAEHEHINIEPVD